MGLWDDHIGTNPGILQSVWSSLCSRTASLRTPHGEKQGAGTHGPHSGSEVVWRQSDPAGPRLD